MSEKNIDMNEKTSELRRGTTEMIVRILEMIVRTLEMVAKTLKMIVSLFCIRKLFPPFADNLLKEKIGNVTRTTNRFTN